MLLLLPLLLFQFVFGSFAHPLVNSHPGVAIDLTHPFSNEGTIQWPTANKFNFTILHRDYIAPDRLLPDI